MQIRYLKEQLKLIDKEKAKSDEMSKNTYLRIHLK